MQERCFVLEARLRQARIYILHSINEDNQSFLADQLSESIDNSSTFPENKYFLPFLSTTLATKRAVAMQAHWQCGNTSS